MAARSSASRRTAARAALSASRAARSSRSSRPDGLALLDGEHQRQGRDEPLVRRLGDEGTLADAGLHQAQHAQGRERLAHGRPADAELLGELPLRRQPVPRAKRALLHHAGDLVHDLLVDALAADPLKPSHVRSSVPLPRC
ncbi:MAG: hypothetical protein A6D92_02850 [Symbiobacterium thermophilum]|uniref:Uncharacterized protein n=1 Tax=Symbiobacterium thermophilum TaxID=2734 RepID=A0A1Y2T845_SYMTR|nr:MAG: hypothetical protein A6D92_02850 [Symbiobacterium thermophilum]